MIRGLLLLLAAGMLGAAAPAAQLTVKLIAINDFHGYLEPTETFSLPTADPKHEFDEGKAELLRKQRGGCRSGGTIGTSTCLVGGTLFPPYAIKYFTAPGGKRIGIAFVGVVLRETPVVTTALGVRGLRFADEAAAVNALLPKIAARGVHAVVVLIHQGIFTKVGYDDPSCGGADGDLLAVLDKFDRSIRLVVSGHTHWPYICPSGQGTHNPHVFYTCAGRYGQIVTDLDVTLDVASDTIAGVRAHNDQVVNDRAPNPLASSVPALPAAAPIAALVARYRDKTTPLVNRVIGHITSDFSLDGSQVRKGEPGESAIGDLIADARLAATVVPPEATALAFINGGGIRAPLPYAALSGTKAPGDVTVGEAYNVEPFGDLLYTETLTGAQVSALLDEQWIGKNDVELLGISRALSYTWDASLPDGASKVVPGSVRVNGRPIVPSASYRVTVDSFMIDGGDGFVVLRQGTQKTTGPIDIQALDAYITAHSPLSPAPLDRVERLH